MIRFQGIIERALEQAQEVLYVTVRAVVQLRSEGIELVVVADGVDVQRDVVERMRFRPLVRTARRMPLS